MRAGGPGQKPSPGQLGSPHEVSFYFCLEFVCICLEFVYTCLDFFYVCLHNILFIFAPLGEQPEAAAGGREVQDRRPRETARGETEAYC